MNEGPTIKILLLGDSDVGKTAFLSRLSAGPDTTSEVGARVLRDGDQPFVFEIKAKKGPFRLEVSDTASPENYMLIDPDLIILCFNVSDRTTLQSVQAKWKPLVETRFNTEERRPVMLLGLKRDMREEDSQSVMPQEAVRIAQEMRCDRYGECSVVTGELVGLVMEDIVKLAIATVMDEHGGKSQASACVIL
ncbi:MAG: hypothetical protein M1831_003778 [Alyxoria varia]|nr:MAG: hypothetical protein M1831_003778 [Alyxoria varia]